MAIQAASSRLSDLIFAHGFLGFDGDCADCADGSGDVSSLDGWSSFFTSLLSHGAYGCQSLAEQARHGCNENIDTYENMWYE